MVQSTIQCSTVNIEREFLKLVDRHFPLDKRRKDKLDKIINIHTGKTSYSGTPNMARIISSHNRKVLQEKRKKEKPDQKESSCQKGGK